LDSFSDLLDSWIVSAQAILDTFPHVERLSISDKDLNPQGLKGPCQRIKSLCLGRRHGKNTHLLKACPNLVSASVEADLGSEAILSLLPLGLTHLEVSFRNIPNQLQHEVYKQLRRFQNLQHLDLISLRWAVGSSLEDVKSEFLDIPTSVRHLTITTTYINGALDILCSLLSHRFWLPRLERIRFVDSLIAPSVQLHANVIEEACKKRDIVFVNQ
jgi:hypothetical protein